MTIAWPLSHNPAKKATKKLIRPHSNFWLLHTEWVK